MDDSEDREERLEALRQERRRQEAADQRDAARYRWLRDPKRLEDASDDDGPAEDGLLFIGVSSYKRWGISDAEADAAIDAAMQANMPPNAALSGPHEGTTK